MIDPRVAAEKAQPFNGDGDRTRTRTRTRTHHALQSSSAEHPDEWHFLASHEDGSPNQGVQCGPVSFAQLIQAYDNEGSDLVVGDTLCWAPGMADWAPLSSMVATV